MRRLVVNWPAPEGARLLADSFAGEVGKALPVRVGARTWSGVLVRVDVAPDGASAALTVDVPDELDDVVGGS